MRKPELAFIKKAKKCDLSKNLAPVTAPVSYTNKKNAWMDSEIFRGQFFHDSPHYTTFRYSDQYLGPVDVG
jgi:hypothetical protein